MEKPEFLGISDKIKIAIQTSMLCSEAALMNQTQEDLALGELIVLSKTTSQDEAREILTARCCSKASLHTLKNLFSSHPDFFDTMIAIRAEHNPNGEFFNEWDFHQYFLVKDILGLWHAGSPANYENRVNKPNRLTQIFSGDLETVLSRIKNFEGGVWPSKKIIEGEVEPLKLRMPELTEAGLFGLIVFRSKNVESYRKMDFKSGKVLNWPIPITG